LCRADLTREPLAVRPRRDPILAALQDQDRRVDLTGFKTPRADVRQVVVDHPARAAVEGAPSDLSQP
jgi:hypothetical protein